MGLLTFLLLLTCFCLPGVLLARSLFRETRNPFFLLAAGFILSLGVFGILAWPCLWLRVNVTTFWAGLGPWWAIYLVAAIVARRSLTRGRSHADRGYGRRAPRAIERATCYGGGGAAAPGVLLLYYMCSAIVAGYAAPLLGGSIGRLPWLSLATLLVSSLVAGVVLALHLRRGRPFQLDLGPDSSPPSTWVLVASVAGISLVVAVMLWSRPQSDDAYYLSATRQFVEGGLLNHEDPSLPGEGLPVAPHMRLLAWELFGATLSRFSGLHPMIVYFTLLPPLLIPTVIAVHWELLDRRLSGRRLAPMAILGLIGFWLFCNSGVFSAGYSLLTRPWQGKSMAWLLGLPSVVVALWEFLSAPSMRTWLGCLLMATGMLAMSSSAVFLLASLFPTFCISMALWGIKKRWATYATAMTPCSVVIIYGALIHSALSTHPVLTRKDIGANWRWSFYQCFSEEGSSLLLWILSLPTLAALLPSRGAGAYLVGLPLVLGVTVLNPLAFDVVASYLTSYQTHSRLFWLLPVGLGLAVVVALVADFAASAWERKGRGFVVRLVVVLGMVATLACLPDQFAWDLRGWTSLSEPRSRWNPYKMPDDLLQILERLESDKCATWGRVLFPESLSQFIAPYPATVRWVSTRRMYTIDALTAAGRPEEACERVALTSGLWQGPQHIDEVSRLLIKHKVSAVLLGFRSPGDEEVLRRAGFRLYLQQGIYQLWRRPSFPSCLTWRTSAALP